MSRQTVELPDARAQLTPDGSGIQGWQCVRCAHRVALPAPWCPRCRSEMTPCDLGASGVVWSSTVLRVPLPGRRPPMSLAYVNLDSGPRVLAHIANSDDRPIAVGAAVTLAGLSEAGDILFGADEGDRERAGAQ